MNFIDLCCGIGGFHHALTRLGMTCVLASDIDKECRRVYEKNFKMKVHGDLKDIEIESIPSFDVLCAGFPCQPFSKAGAQNGFNDDRGHLFFDICKIVEYHKPKYMILENVRNLASHDNGNTWNVIRQKINALDYHTYENPVILNTLYFGVPQSRERVVILCKRKDLGDLPTLPSISKKNIQKTDLSTIIECVESNQTHKYKLDKKQKVTEEVWDDFLQVCYSECVTIPKFPIWTDWWDCEITKETLAFYEKYKSWIDKNRSFYNTYKKPLDDWLRRSRHREEWKGAVRKMEWQTGRDGLTMKEVLWSPRGSGIRIKNTDYSPTLVAMTSMIPIYGPLSRQLTPRECARLQSFPDDFIIHENDKIAYKQFGNAVNVIMIERSARFLIFNQSLF